MTDKSLVPLSPAETEIFRLVCETPKAAVQDICDALPPERNIAYATVQTLLRRLEKKGYLTHSVLGKAHIFEPAVRKQDVIGTAVKSFLDKLFGGNPAELMQYLAENDKITREDLEKLRGIQWIPGDGQPAVEEWLDVLKQIRDAGQLCQVYVSAKGALQIARELGGKGFAFSIEEPMQAEDAEGFLNEIGCDS